MYKVVVKILTNNELVNIRIKANSNTEAAIAVLKALLKRKVYVTFIECVAY